MAEFATGGVAGRRGDTARIVLLDGETYSPGAARNFDFTEDIPARHILTFEIAGTATGYAIMLSDDLLALTAQSGGPSTTANSYGMYTRNHTNSLPTQNQGNSWLCLARGCRFDLLPRLAWFRRLADHHGHAPGRRAFHK